MNEVMEYNAPATTTVTEQQAAAWVGLAERKNSLAKSLQGRELAAQNILAPVLESDSHTAIDAALALYRKAHTEMVEERKVFTGMIDANIIQPLMAFEKRVDPAKNETALKLSARSLEIRKKEEAIARERSNKIAEQSNFKLFVGNEYLRIKGEYRAALQKRIDVSYAEYLSQGEKSPSLETVKKYLADTPPPQMAKFARVYCTPEELLALFNDMHPLDLAPILEEMQESVDSVFANYQSDLANAAEAIRHREEQSKLQEQEEKRKAAEEMAMNTLITTAETVVVEGPKIKRTVQVVVVESEAWAKAVMAAFITNLPNLHKYIKVKSWGKLTIGQMADYLGKYASETGEVFNGLQFVDVEK